MSRSHKTADASFVVAPRRDLCLDFANTLMWRGSEREETLHDHTELLRWCEANQMIEPEAVQRAIRWAEESPDNAAAIFARAIALRESIYRIFFAMAEHRAADPRDIAALNEALESAPARCALASKGKSFGWRIDRDASSATSLLAPVLWSAGDLMVSSDTERLRHCSNDKCLWLFFDDSKNGSRRWCSMQACGNRAKAHRHYLKSKSA